MKSHFGRSRGSRELSKLIWFRGLAPAAEPPPPPGRHCNGGLAMREVGGGGERGMVRCYAARFTRGFRGLGDSIGDGCGSGLGLK